MMPNDASFILGCQRSGTTLLRLLFAAHPEVCSVDEALAYPVLAKRETLPAHVAADADNKRVVFKIPRFSEQLLLEDLRDETYGTCQQFYVAQPSIFVVRDPRDVVASMCTLAATRDKTWIQVQGRRMIDHRVRERAGFAKLYAAELEELEQQSWPAHLMAALYWRVKNDALPSYLAQGLPILAVIYEDLVRDPEAQLRRICAHLQLEWTDNMLHHHDNEHGQLEASGLAIGSSDPKRAIDSTSVGRYADALDSKTTDDVMAWAGEHYERLRAST